MTKSITTRHLAAWALAGAALAAGSTFSQPARAPAALVDAARGPTPIAEETRPPVLGNAVNDDQRRRRAFTMQPPVIPHRIDGYQVDKNFNKCLDCHARTRTEFSQAVPVSITHYMDRDGRTLPQISTRRYFCQQCHVAQDAAPPLVGNTFVDVDTLAQRPAPAPAAAGSKKN